jgi:methylmalonyl-CoA mutase
MAMGDIPDDLPLGAEFPAATEEQWLRLVDGVLKGAPFERKLVAKTYDHLPISPLYARAHTQPVAGRAPGAPWAVMQRVDHPDPATANAEALRDLEQGATGVSLVFGGSVGAYGYGLAASEEAITRALDGVHLDAGAGIELDLGTHRKSACEAIAELVRQRAIATARTNIRFGLDPLGEVAATGKSPHALADLTTRLAQSVTEFAALGFKGPFAVADGRIVHNAGGSEAQELAFALAVAVTYLRALEAGGIPIDHGRGMIFFRLSADADQFLTIAKFRALRKLWARVEAVCGLAPEPIIVSAETAWRMMTKRDPWVNMLRATIAVFSAGLGGADSISVLPYTMALGLPDHFARRMARNTQLILLEESNLAKVTDPAAGSGAIEDLTQKLSAAAWGLFQDIERAGGAGPALEQGLIQRQVAITRAERQAAVAHRNDALTGTSEFPDIQEAPVSVLDVAPVASAPSEPPLVSVEAMASLRFAEPFEQLRDASDATLARTGTRPRVFLANLGALAEFTARAMFARNFFEAGGIAAVSNDGFAVSSPTREATTDLDALVAAFKASGATLACLCSSDQVYAREAAAAARALRAADAKHVYLAGRAGEREASLKDAGVGTFIHVGCDVLAILQAAQYTDDVQSDGIGG